MGWFKPKSKPASLSMVVHLDRPRTFVFDRQAVAQYHRLTGRHLAEGGREGPWDEFDFCELLAAGLVHEDPVVTPDFVLRWIGRGDTLPVAVEKVNRLLDKLRGR